MQKIEPPKKGLKGFQPGNTLGKGRPKGGYNKDRIVRECISDEELKLLINVLKDKALKGDTEAAKMIVKLLPRERVEKETAKPWFGKIVKRIQKAIDLQT